MSFTTEKIISTEYVETPSFTTAQIDAKIIANELPAGVLVYNSETDALQVSTGVGVTPVVYSPILSHVTAFSATDVQNAQTTPLILVPAPGVGKYISLASIGFKFTYGGVTPFFSGNQDDKIVYDGSAVNVGIAYFPYGTTVDTILPQAGQYAAPLAVADVENKAITFKPFGDPITDGTGSTIQFVTYYSVSDV